MEAAVIDEIPGRPALRKVRTGPPGRTDVRRPPICPDGHVGRIRIDRITAIGAFHSRVGYRCAYRAWDPLERAWVEKRHRFTEPRPDDPLPRRHPTHEHSYSQDNCPTCEHQYDLDEGPRAGRDFYFTAGEIASLLIGVGQGHPIKAAIADVRRNALRFRPKTASHRSPDTGPTAEDLAWLETVAWLEETGSIRPIADLEDTDDGVRFRRGLGEDFEPDTMWDDWSDEPISDAELLRAYSGEDDLASRTTALPPVPPSPGEMVDDERYLSKSFALGAEYVDVFGPAVVAPFHVTEWPEAIAIDSQPMRRRALVQGVESDRVASDFLCEIFAVQDGLEKDLILLYPAGTKDQEAIKEVFAQKTGAPKWIVTDGDSAMPAAIKAAFGEDVIHYRCEEHLRDDARDFAKKDKIDDPAVLMALERAQFTPAHWEHLKATVAARVEPSRHLLRKWIADNETLVLHQCELRRLHPGYPRSTGGPEVALTKVRHDLNPRRAALRNRRRLVIVLDLMRIAYIHKARPERYAKIVREQLEAGRHKAVDWNSHWDRMVKDKRGRLVLANSLIEYRDRSRERSALAREIEARAATMARQVVIKQAAFDQAVADGGQPTGRARRPEPIETFAKAGDMVANVPTMMALWDFAKNTAEGLDPEKIAAQSNAPAHWLCTKHEAGDPDGRWPGHLHEWSASPSKRARKNPGCRFCMRKYACPGNCLRVTHPRLATPEEWDYATNDAEGMTPDAELSGSKKNPSWLCPRGHGAYRMLIVQRTKGRYCKECTKEDGAAKRLARVNEKRREQHTFAARGRARLASEQAVAEGDLFSEHSID